MLDIDNLDTYSLKLRRLDAKELDTKRVKSLQMKYITIPDEYLSYFPDPVAVDDEGDEIDEASHPGAAITHIEAAPVAAVTAGDVARRKRPRVKTP